MANFTPNVSQDYTGSFDEEVHTEYIVKEEELKEEWNLDTIPHRGDHNAAQQPGKFIHSFPSDDFDVHSLNILQPDLSDV